MPINSQDDLLAALGAGQTQIVPFNKNALSVSVQTVGAWYDLSKGGGNPAADALLGANTNLTFQPVSDTTTTTAVTTGTGSSITTTVLTVGTMASGKFTVGMTITGTGVTAGTMIVSLGTGTGGAGTYNLNISQTVAATTITGTATASFLQHGGNVSTAIKYLLNASVFSAAATSCPTIFQLVDIIGFIPVDTVTLTSAQTILGSQTYPRYADGKGVMAYIVPIVVTGAGTPTLRLNYTNPAASSGRLTPATPSLPIATATCPVGQVIYSGTGAGKFGPFMPLQAGDNGILSIQSIQQSATMTSGVYAIVLCKPIGLPIPATTVGVPGERDFINQLPSMPTIPDGACLNWLQYAGAATPVNTPYFGSIQTVWKA